MLTFDPPLDLAAIIIFAITGAEEEPGIDELVIVAWEAAILTYAHRNRAILLLLVRLL